MILFTPNKYTSEELGILVLAERVSDACDTVGTASRGDYKDPEEWDRDVERVNEWAEAFFKACANYKGERFVARDIPVPVYDSPEALRKLADEVCPPRHEEEPPHPAEDEKLLAEVQDGIPF